MLTAQIPQGLREILEAEADEFKGSDLAQAAEALSRAYRAGLPPRLDSALARAAYAITRMPATFGAISSAAAELPFEADSWLDLCSGPGTAAWAAPCDATLVEQNAGWREFSPGNWIEADVRRLPPLEPHEVVSISYGLNELSARDRIRVIDDAWALASRAMLLVEPGTPEGSELMLAARDQLIALGAHIFAPCPHAGPCTMPSGDWCHFAVRVARTKAHKQAKGGELPYEDEKFCYLIALREAPAAAPAPRILRHPIVQKNLIQLNLCTSGGITLKKVNKRDKAEWRAARKADWGGRFDPTQPAPAGADSDESAE